MRIYPEYNAASAMSLSGIQALHTLATTVKGSIVPKEELGFIIVFLLTELVCHPGAVGFYSHLFKLFKSGGAVVVKVRGYGHDYPLSMPGLDGVEERQQLTSIPGRVEEDDTFVGD